MNLNEDDRKNVGKYQEIPDNVRKYQEIWKSTMKIPEIPQKYHISPGIHMLLDEEDDCRKYWEI